MEIFLVRKVGERRLSIGGGDGSLPETRDVEVWRALGKASKPLKFDTDIVVGATEAPPGAAAPAGLQLVVRLLGRAEDVGLLEVGLAARGGGAA